MAGTLTVSFDNSTPIGGPFRIAYQYPAWNGNPASTGYPTLYVIESGVVCGTPLCNYNINLPIITDEACNVLTISGYIQPECEAPSSLVNRIPFTATFTPTPPCNAVKLTCSSPACNPIDLKTGCHGILGTVSDRFSGENFSICYLGGITGAQFLDVQADIITAGYTVEPNPSVCCYDCVEVTIEFDDTLGLTGVAQYEACNGLVPLVETINYTAGVPSPPITLCVRRDSWSTNRPTAITFTQGSICTV